ncbi:transcriptional regulator, AraC family [Pseudoduganella lurida]|uniref:Transcriptional regulator, AraC family n=1 Tax=Pseudoduganella lurida TaxID=1036180 RepID=A0A562RAX9_9BURK|nr:AraC family transcriptional regulator [Pseudoduganella lurida]TWI66198.1 transcriptional regulator, AraC family [Pseudoduganella lurida]
MNRSSDETVRQRMVALLRQLATAEGYNLTGLPDVRLLRSDRLLERTPVLYDPGIVIVCQGRKRGWLGDKLYLYDAQHYLAVAVPVPFTMETDASTDEPLLAIYLHLDFAVVADLLLALPPSQTGAARSMVSSPMDGRLQQVVLRLLEALADPLDAQVLGPALVRELYYRVLTGEQGHVLRAALAQQGRFSHIARAVRRIHADYARPLAVAWLAQEASMSVATFHLHFKTVTGSAPLQYIKSVRLHQARLLMVRAGMAAAVAAAAVGYDSPSQFSREFRRLFGRPPGEEADRLRSGFALPPPVDSAYVSSH